MIPLDAQVELSRALTERLRGRVKLDLFTQRQTSLVVPGREPCVVCPSAEELIADIARLSPLFTLTVHQLGADRPLEARLGVQRVPATVVRGGLNRPLLFCGVPLPPLFNGFMDLAILASLDKVELQGPVPARLRRLRDAVSLQVLVLNEAEFCLEMMQLAFAFGAASKQVQVEVIELASFPALAERIAPSHVPFTTINGRTRFAGLVTAETLMDLIVQTVAHPTILAKQPPTLGMTPVEQVDPGPQPAWNEPTRRPSGLYVL